MRIHEARLRQAFTNGIGLAAGPAQILSCLTHGVVPTGEVQITVQLCLGRRLWKLISLVGIKHLTQVSAAGHDIKVGVLLTHVTRTSASGVFSSALSSCTTPSAIARRWPPLAFDGEVNLRIGSLPRNLT